MKKIKKGISLLLAGVILALGFGSCGTQKQALKKVDDIQKQIDDESAKLGKLQQEASKLKAMEADLQKEIKRLQEVPLVYAPPVPRER